MGAEQALGFLTLAGVIEAAQDLLDEFIALRDAGQRRQGQIGYPAIQVSTCSIVASFESFMSITME